MGIMLDNMKRFAEELRACDKDRKSDLKGIKNATVECLEGARGFVIQIGQAHNEMASEQRSAMAASRAELLESVNAARGQNQQQLAETRDELRKSLGREMRNLKKSVNSFRTRCKKDQTHLANELRQVAKIWAKRKPHTV